LRSAVPSKGWHAKVDGGGVAGAPGELGELDELAVGAGEADLEAFDLAEPALALGFGDAGGEVVADLLQARSLRWVWSQERTSDTRVFMNAGRSERASAGPDGHLSFLEVGEEGIPLLVGRGSVFFAGAGRPAPGNKRPVRLDRFGWVDRLYPMVVSIVLWPQMTCAICGGRPLMMASVTKILRKSWGENISGSLLASVSPVAASALMSSLRIAVGVNARCSLPIARWNSSGIGELQTFSRTCGCQRVGPWVLSCQVVFCPARPGWSAHDGALG
jgi:hypothetical protein